MSCRNLCSLSGGIQSQALDERGPHPLRSKKPIRTMSILSMAHQMLELMLKGHYLKRMKEDEGVWCFAV